MCRSVSSNEDHIIPSFGGHHPSSMLPWWSSKYVIYLQNNAVSSKTTVRNTILSVSEDTPYKATPIDIYIQHETYLQFSKAPLPMISISRWEKNWHAFPSWLLNLRRSWQHSITCRHSLFSNDSRYLLLCNQIQIDRNQSLAYDFSTHFHVYDSSLTSTLFVCTFSLLKFITLPSFPISFPLSTHRPTAPPPPPPWLLPPPLPTAHEPYNALKTKLHSTLEALTDPG